MTFWTCLFKGTISSTVDFKDGGGGIKEEAISSKYLSSSSKRVPLFVHFFKSKREMNCKFHLNRLSAFPKMNLSSSMVCSRLIYKKKENNGHVSKKVRPPFRLPSFSPRVFCARESGINISPSLIQVDFLWCPQR